MGGDDLEPVAPNPLRPEPRASVDPPPPPLLPRRVQVAWTALLAVIAIALVVIAFDGVRQLRVLHHQDCLQRVFAESQFSSDQGSGSASALEAQRVAIRRCYGIKATVTTTTTIGR